MRQVRSIFFFWALLLLSACADRDQYTLREGDIIFQTSRSSQSRAIQLATKSRYSHMGIIYINKGNYYVYEAIQPVRLTPLDTWIRRGENGHYVVKRLKEAGRLLTPTARKKMRKVGEHFRGKDYDLTFEWSDDRIYCSELVWKIYKRGLGIEIGRLQRLRDFDLRHPDVRNKMRERYGSNVPYDEYVVSPESMFHSNLLRTVVTH